MIWPAIIIIGGSLAILAWMILTAPEGYQDAEHGFQLGPTPPYVPDNTGWSSPPGPMVA